MSASAWGFIGTFSAPGTGDVGVLGLELTHDFDTGVKRGVARLEKRPYWEGLTRFTLDMPATSEREAMCLTGLWTERGEFDGEMCHVTLEAVELVTAQAPTPAPHQEIAWHELRSACHRRDWRAAWEVIGTDHEGEATPGEVYIFGVARQARAVSAALHTWCQVASEVGPVSLESFGARRACRRALERMIKGGDRWQRIKRVAGWKSQAAAQYVKPAPKVYRIDYPGVGFDMRITVGDREITGQRGEWAVVDDPVPPRMISTPFRTPDLFGRLARRMSFEDESTPLDTLREIQRMTQGVRTMPSEIWISPEVAATVQRASMEQAQGIAGVLSNPFMPRVRVVPQAMVDAAQESNRAQRRRRR